MVVASILEANNGKLPAFAWPGGYPLVYTDGEGLPLCAQCAQKSLEHKSIGSAVAGVIRWEGPPIPCDDCGDYIFSTYGETEGE